MGIKETHEPLLIMPVGYKTSGNLICKISYGYGKLLAALAVGDELAQTINPNLETRSNVYIKMANDQNMY